MDSHEQIYIRNPKFRKPKEQEDDKEVSESSKE